MASTITPANIRAWGSVLVRAARDLQCASVNRLSGYYGHRVELAVQRNEDSGLAYLKIELIVSVATKTNKKKIKLGLGQLDAIHRIQIS